MLLMQGARVWSLIGKLRLFPHAAWHGQKEKKKTRCFDTVMLSHPCIYTTGVNKSQLIVFLCWICFTSIFLELLEHIDCFSSNSGQTLFLQIYFVCFVSSSGIPIMNVCVLNVVSHFHKALFIFLHSFQMRSSAFWFGVWWVYSIVY